MQNNNGSEETKPETEKKDYELTKLILTLATAVIGLVNAIINLIITLH